MRGAASNVEDEELVFRELWRRRLAPSEGLFITACQSGAGALAPAAGDDRSVCSAHLRTKRSIQEAM